MRVFKMSNTANKKWQTAIVATAVILLGAATAEARHGWRGGPGRGGGGPERWGGPHMRCAKMLMRAHPDVLRDKLGLKPDQVTRIRKLRSNFRYKRITARAEIQRHRLQMRELFEASGVPADGKVLGLMRKIRAKRGRLMEERMKTHLAAMRTLTGEQRTTLRTKCRKMRGHGKWMHGRRGGPGGRGPGGRGGGGPGGWGHGGPGW